MEKDTYIMIKNMEPEIKRKFKAKTATDGTNMTDKLKEMIKGYINED